MFLICSYHFTEVIACFYSRLRQNHVKYSPNSHFTGLQDILDYQANTNLLTKRKKVKVVFQRQWFCFFQPYNYIK